VLGVAVVVLVVAVVVIVVVMAGVVDDVDAAPGAMTDRLGMFR